MTNRQRAQLTWQNETEVESEGERARGGADKKDALCGAATSLLETNECMSNMNKLRSNRMSMRINASAFGDSERRARATCVDCFAFDFGAQRVQGELIAGAHALRRPPAAGAEEGNVHRMRELARLRTSSERPIPVRVHGAGALMILMRSKRSTDMR